MKHDNTKKLRPLKGTDSAARLQFLGCFFRVFCASGLLGLIIGGTIGIFVAAIFSVFVSVLIKFVTEKFGGMASTLYGGRRPTLNVRAQLEADLDRVRYHKMQKHFGKALAIVNRVLDQDSGFPDALFLKAQILSEGFKSVKAAKRCLRKVMELVPNKQETIHCWASTFYHDLTEIENGPNRH